MLPIKFLRTVWPDEGIYCLATPYTTPSGLATYSHKTFDTIADAATFVNSQKSKHNIFFAIHTLKEHKVWNPAKTDWRTGELGANETRVQSNSKAAKCFFFDLDVGESTSRLQKYSSRKDALNDLIRFTNETGLPKPLITSSGGGLHVYWVLDDPTPSTEWRHYAAKLRQLASHHGLRADPARTTDTASVLRVAGTFNLKDRANPRPVEVLFPGKSTPNATFLKLLDNAVVTAGVTVKALPTLPVDNDGFGTNIVDEFTGSPVSFKAVLTVCAQVQRQVRLSIAHDPDVSEPEWYHTLNLLRFVENGHVVAHKYSSGHPSYDKDETDKKLHQLEQKGIKPTSCFKLAEVAGDDACEGCPFAGRVKNPLAAARFKDAAPPPVVTQIVGPTTLELLIPEPPYPFTRMKDGGIAVEAKNKDGDEVHTVILKYDLYPIRRLVNTLGDTEQQMWRVVLPRAGERDFVLDADAMYDPRKFLTAISNIGIYPQRNHVQLLQDYMIAYISELQRMSDSEAQSNHLGWSDDHHQFILPDKILMEDGSVRAATLGLGASRSSAHVKKKGTLIRQQELLKFYEDHKYIPNQFFIMASLAAPLFYATGHHGVVINASGEAGAYKSTTLYTAASLWGQPELYPINGTNNGATTRGRNERITTLSNLPVCVDEITHMLIKDAVDLAMSITQPGHRIRLERNGVEQATPENYKATIMLTTANSSLHSVLSTDNTAGTAGSMRVLEIIFREAMVHRKFEADEYWHELKENYGHIGEVFMHYVVQNRKDVELRVRKAMREIDDLIHTRSAERFWSAAIATVVVAGEIAVDLGLLTYNVSAVREWALKRQVPYMRGVVSEEYSNPIATIADYLEVINGDILIAHKHSTGNIANVVKTPRGAMLAHYNLDTKQMWVLKKGFKDYCQRTGANFFKILDELSQPHTDKNGFLTRVITEKHSRKVLGAGTEYAKAQSWCFVINMDHKEISGVVELDVTTTASPTITPPKGKLRPV